MTVIAIHPDNYTNPATPKKVDAASPRWADLLQSAGYKVKWVDVRRPDILEQLQGCQGFMWRWAHFAGMGRIARRLLPVIERELGLVVYPDQNTCWHYDDKIAQTYLLKASGIPMPETWIWFDAEGAKEWALSANYPVVIKLSAGASSENVRLIKDTHEAFFWIDRLFRYRISSLEGSEISFMRARKRLRSAARILRRGITPDYFANGYELHTGYVLFQEFLPDNPYDTRITVIGNRAFGLRRDNRDQDFRASGSGIFYRDPNLIDPLFLRLAFRTAQSLSTQSCAVDGLYRGKECVITEVSYTYISWAVHDSPGHWVLSGSPEEGELNWNPGKMWPEEAQVEDFIKRIHAKY